MKKAIVFISMGLMVGGILYHAIQAHRVTAELVDRYPAMSIFGQMKKGRTRYDHMGR